MVDGNDLKIPNSQVLHRMFAHPSGFLGHLGGWLMGLSNQDIAQWTIEALDIQPRDRVLEIGFGPGEALRQLAQTIPDIQLHGVDASGLMVTKARKLNRAKILSGNIDVRHGTVETLPYPDGSFDKAFSINSMPFWEHPIPGLREIRRVLSPGGNFVVTVQPRWAKTDQEIQTVEQWMEENLSSAGFFPMKADLRSFEPVPAIRFLILAPPENVPSS
jgi:ubiquinone/menaquinone biosynthesis C-methylase UbiE